MERRYIIKEYDSFTKNIEVTSSKYHTLPAATFDKLEEFILSKKQETETDVLELMSISSKRGIGKIISAKNYVGLITMKDGTEIEILPKLYTQGEESSEIETKKTFIEMLKFLKDFPYKSFTISNLHAEKNNILEIFIGMFIEETHKLVKKGLKLDYIQHQGNEYFYKGKLLFSQHIKLNFAHRERFYIEYDLFSVNRVENKLIKTTINFLKSITSIRQNKKDLHKLLTMFETIDYSTNPSQDFSKITYERNMKEYETILKWCRIFLTNKSFTTFKGDGVAYSLLFPMEKVFESYVAGQLKKVLDKSLYRIKTQDQAFHLFDDPKRFLLKPDIVVQRYDSSVILDTKWKLLSQDKSNYGVSQADMYQTYVYGKKYSCSLVFLLYPWTPEMNNTTNFITYQSKDKVKVCIGILDVLDIKNSMKKLLLKIEENIFV